MRFSAVGGAPAKLQKLKENLNATPQAVRSVMRELARVEENELIGDLRTPPPRPHRTPWEWTTEKQRRAFFATDGFGRGIPTQRTGKVTAGWRVRVENTPEGGRIIIENTTPYAKYVYGQFTKRSPQQRFHSITGWPTIHLRRQRWRSIIQRIRYLVAEKLMEG